MGSEPTTLLAIDAGTTGVTGMLFDRDLRALRRAYREFPQSFPRPGWVEHDADAILGALDEVLGELLAHPEAANLAAIGITNQRETVFALERATCRALGPGIVWQDRRTAERCAELARAGHGPRVQELTGLLLDPYFSGTKIEWMLRADADLARRADAGEVCFATVDALVVAHLTGGRVLATDPTNASRSLLYDIDARSWSTELGELLGVQPSWLPEVRPSVGDFGTSDPARCHGRTLPIAGVAGDQQAALFGQGCFERGSFKVTFGTGSFLLLNTGDERPRSDKGLLTTLAVGRRGECVHALEGSVFTCGALIQWLRDELGFFSEAAEVEALAASVPDSGGVACVPAFTGLGAPHWDPDARGALLGLTRGTTRAHVARAALEALALQNAELIEVLRAESGLPIDEALVDGGAAANDLLMQLQADLAGLHVRRPPSVEATARGAAALAGLSVGLWSDPAQAGVFGQDEERFAPRMEPGARATRLEAWADAVDRVRSARRP